MEPRFVAASLICYPAKDSLLERGRRERRRREGRRRSRSQRAQQPRRRCWPTPKMLRRSGRAPPAADGGADPHRRNPFAGRRSSPPSRFRRRGVRRACRAEGDPALNSKAELAALAMSNTDALGQSMGFWDPLGLADGDFWGLATRARRHLPTRRSSTARHGRLPRLRPVHAPRVRRARGRAHRHAAGVTPCTGDNIPRRASCRPSPSSACSVLRRGRGQPAYTHHTKGGLPASTRPSRARPARSPSTPAVPIFPEQSRRRRSAGAADQQRPRAMLGLMSLLSASAVPGPCRRCRHRGFLRAT